MLTRTRWPYPRILAHRGGGSVAPENTLVGIRAAAGMGFAGVEIDVQLAACGTPVLMHDTTVDRTTDGYGNVAEFSADELRRLDAGVWFGNEYAGEHVPTLEAAVALCRATIHRLGCSCSKPRARRSPRISRGPIPIRMEGLSRRGACASGSPWSARVR